MPDQPAHMWSYWRDDKGLLEALEDYYPETLKNDPTIQHAYRQVKAGLTVIDTLMKERQEAAEDALYEDPGND